MFNSVIIDVATGLILSFLAVSLAASAITEDYGARVFQRPVSAGGALDSKRGEREGGNVHVPVKPLKTSG